MLTKADYEKVRAGFKAIDESIDWGVVQKAREYWADWYQKLDSCADLEEKTKLYNERLALLREQRDMQTSWGYPGRDWFDPKLALRQQRYAG